MNEKALTITLNPSVDKTYIVDRFQPGEIHIAADTYAVAGGKGNNVARVLRSLHHEVRATGFLGGAAGDWIASHLAAAGIEEKFVRIDGETRTCLTIVEQRGHGIITELREQGPFVPEDAQAKLLGRLPSLVDGCRIVAVSGSLPPGVAPSFLGQLVSALRTVGCKVILDTSGSALLAGLQAGPTLIKPNEAELSTLAGTDVSVACETDIPGAVRAAAETAVAYGVAVVVSLGAYGAHWAKPDGTGFTVRAPSVRAVNTVGAGDSFVAGLVSGMMRGCDPVQTLRLAVACGSASVLNFEVAAVRKKDVDELLARMD